MNKINSKTIFWIAITILSLITAIAFFQSRGTIDVKIRMEWVDNMQNFGWAHGYEISRVDYPPLGLLILYYVAKVAKYTFLDYSQSWHLMTLFSMIATSVVMYLITKKYSLSVGTFLMFLLVSIVLGYTDIVFAPFLLMAIYFMRSKNYLLAGIFYFISVSIKWQPLILLPLFGIQLLELKKNSFKLGKSQINSLIQFGLGFLVVYLPQYKIFGDEILISLKRATQDHHALSANALNLGRVIYDMHLSAPVIYLEKFLRYTFYSVYLLIIYKFINIKKTFYQFVLFLFMSSLSYFILNVGVHENHLFLATLVAPILYYLNPTNIYLLVYWGLALNLNLVYFYSITGSWPFDGDSINFAINALSYLNLIYYIYLIYNFFSNKFK